MSWLFISHSSHDNAAAERIRQLLEGEGYDAVFLDIDPEAGIAAGRDWEKELYAQLRRADAVVFLGSPDALASQWCFAELALARSIGATIIPLTLGGTPVHPLLGSVQWLELRDRDDETLAALLATLREHALESAGSDRFDPARSPYPGLRTFEPEDAAVFFGREHEVQELVRRLHPTLQRGAQRLVGVVGSSGSGKSSLVRAGLIPQLRRRGAWTVLTPMEPGARPLRRFARILAHTLGDPTAAGEIARRLKEDPAALDELLEELCLNEGGEPARSVLLVIDQAEELATVSESEEREALLALLASTLGERSPLWVVATIRSEFLDAVLADGQLARVFNEPQLLGPLGRDRLFEVVTRPARRVGLEIEPALTARIVDDTVGGDALPLLAHTLRRMWDERVVGRQGLTLTLADYEAVGGVVGSLREQADQIVDELDRRDLGSSVFPALTQLAALEGDAEPVRRRITVERLRPEEREVLAAFVDARLLVSGQDEGEGATIEVAHEALLRHWPPLREAIEAARTDLRTRSELERLTQDWEQAGRRDAYLLDGDRLRAAEVWAASHERDVVAAPAIEAFLDAGRQIAAARAQRRADVLAERVLDGFPDDPELAILLALAAAQEQTATPRVVLALGAALDASSVRGVLRGHAGNVLAVDVSPDGRCVATGGEDGTCRIWDAHELRELRVLEHGHGWLWTVAFSPDGRSVATGSDDGRLSVWDVNRGERLNVLAGHEAAIISADWSTAGIATASDDRTIRIWEPSERRPRFTLRGHEDRVAAVAFAPDGSRLLSGSYDRTARVWSLEGSTGRETLRLADHEGTVRAVAWALDGRRMATASYDGTCGMYDPESGRRLATARGHDGPVRGVAFDATGDRLATVSEDRTARVWRAETGEELSILRGHRGRIRGVAFSPDGAQLITCGEDGTVRSWDVGGRGRAIVLAGHATTVRRVRFSPRGDRVLTGSEDGTARVWAADDGRLLRVCEAHGATVHDAVYSPDGRRILTASEDGTAAVWDADRGGAPRVLRGHAGWVVSVAVSPDGHRALTASFDGTARIWSLDSVEPAQVLTREGAGQLEDARWAPGGGQILTAGWDGFVGIWDARSGALCHQIEVGASTRAAWSPDGRRVATATGGGNGGCRIWDAATAELLVTLPVSTRQAEFSPDGRRVLTVSQQGLAEIWDAAIGEGLVRCVGHRAGIRAGVWSPEGDRVATASEDGTARIWDAATGAELAILRGHQSGLRHLAFSPDGSRIATASADGTARIWDLHLLALDELVALAPARVFRALTDDERTQFGLG